MNFDFLDVSFAICCSISKKNLEMRGLDCSNSMGHSFLALVNVVRNLREPTERVFQ